jgi:hypothetical protein
VAVGLRAGLHEHPHGRHAGTIVRAGRLAWGGMETPPPDPQKLLAHWMEWERGETPPGRVMSYLKTGGLREVLESLAARQAEAAAGPPADA